MMIIYIPSYLSLQSASCAFPAPSPKEAVHANNITSYEYSFFFFEHQHNNNVLYSTTPRILFSLPKNNAVAAPDIRSTPQADTVHPPL